MFTLLILIAVPIISWLLLRRLVASCTLSCFVGVVVLWANMIRLEDRAPDSDFDIMFGIAMVVWAIILATMYVMGYAIYFGIAAGVRSFLVDKVETEQEE